MIDKLKRKTVLITGASRGIGKTMAEVFANAGYNVAINFNNSEKQAKELEEVFETKGIFAKAIQANIASANDCKALVEKTLQHFGKIDVLINNAGISHYQIFQDLTEEDFETVIGTNLKGMCFVTKYVLKDMLFRNSGNIINVSSMWGNVGASMEVLYSLSKSGVIGFTKALSKEVGISGIRVNCIAPGVVQTEMNKNLSSEDMEILRNSTSLERIGNTSEVAEVALFLASNKASYVTGQVLTVDGGFI